MSREVRFNPSATVAVNGEKPEEAPVSLSYMFGIYPVLAVALPNRKLESGDTMVVTWTVEAEE